MAWTLVLSVAIFGTLSALKLLRVHPTIEVNGEQFKSWSKNIALTHLAHRAVGLHVIARRSTWITIIQGWTFQSTENPHTHWNHKATGGVRATMRPTKLVSFCFLCQDFFGYKKLDASKTYLFFQVSLMS